MFDQPETGENAFDVIVIGGGHNGLTAAATLAKRGRRVCVVERSAGLGGMAGPVDFPSGAGGPAIAHLLYNLSPPAMAEIGVGESTPLATKRLPTVALASDGRHAVIDDSGLCFADGSAHPEAGAFAALRARLETCARVLGQLADAPPPSLEGGVASLSLAGVREIGSLAKLGLDLKRLRRAEMREFLRIILSNAYDLILDDLEDGPVAGALAADAVRGAFSGPRAPGTVLSLLYRIGRRPLLGADLPIGGPGAVASAFETAARSAGVEIRTGAPVAHVMVRRDRARGVVLEDGTEIAANAVMSSLDALQTMKLAGPAHFDVETVRRLRNIRAKGAAGKVHLALDAAPDMPGLTDEQRAGRLIVAPSATYVERAFNPAKYGEMSAAPVIEAVIPSLSDEAHRAGGRHVLSAIANFAPYDLEGGWTDAARDKLGALTIKTLAAHMPGLAELVSETRVLASPDIEALTGAPGGHWHQGELSLDQLLTVRPVNRLAQYGLGVRGFYFCGAAAHPGGDVAGSAGRNAARRLLKDEVPA